ncbi:transposase [Coraliomargarita algicola]|uniref:Transposase n=1 Tax=Coraliomargarita algicola TaxID=3092156 RepID=A0ABZ0RQT5_9BACT|nr:transposase [Coraliomargarita sp. J2-16]WPJ97513.1 transposase [Coraliomargarita sp. J2-16]
MPRSLRIERENGVYHVINRGNYQQDLFINEGAHRSFEKCLFEACKKCGWILEGFCVMTNHFHLVIRTPKGNLVYGMKWLQSTFANRYHKFRQVHGKLFQGRYKSLIVEEDTYLGALLHYVALNPVRAGICDVEGLHNYRWSSYWYLRNPASRPEFLDPTGALRAAGNLSDTAQGHRSYQAYLLWLSEDQTARKDMAFDKMCRGWALGTKEFKRELLQSEGLLKDGTSERLRMEGKDLAEANELIWEDTLQRGMQAVSRTDVDIANDRKSAAWKVWIAAELKRHTSAPSTWIAHKLNMGSPQLVGVYAKRLEREIEQKPNPEYQDFISKYTE